MPQIPLARLASLAALAVFAALPPAGTPRAHAAHGGGHQPPEPPVSPPDGPPGPNPGPAGRAPAAPTGGGRGPGGPASPAPRAPGKPPAGGPRQPAGGPSTGLPGGGLDPEDWSIWWRLERDRFLRLHEAVWDPGTLTGDDGFFLGHGEGRRPIDLRPKPAEVAGRILPALLAVAAKEQNPEVRSGVLTALAKLGSLPETAGPDPRPALFLDLVDDPNQQIAETAVLCLGLGAARESLFPLVHLLADDGQGRELAGGRVSARTRAFAAYGLGLAARRSANEDVRRLVAQRLVQTLDEDALEEVGVACATALSLIDLAPAAGDLERALESLRPSASREALVRHLANRTLEGKLRARVRAHLARALGALAAADRGDDAGSEALRRFAIRTCLRLLERERRGRRELRQGAVLALGRLVRAGSDPDDVAAREALLALAAQSDNLTRGLACIALGEVASRPAGGDAAQAWEGAGEIQSALLRTVARDKGRVAPWAALALGVAGHRLRARGMRLSGEVGAALREVLTERRSSQDIGAYALALGLRGDVEALPELIERLLGTREQAARGHLAVAIGLFGERSAIDELRPLLADEVYRPHAMAEIAIALALLGDKELVPWLGERIEQETSSARRAVHVWALAFVADARASERLCAILVDPEAPAIERGNAALGLGFLAEPSPLPWRAPLAHAAHWPAATPTLHRADGGGGVLDIR